MTILQPPPSLDPAPAGIFSIIAIPDTQRYIRDNPTAFDRMVQWIAANVASQCIAFVTHLGDVVRHPVPEQWAAADAILRQLDGAVPFGISVGNNDMVETTGDASLFSATFPPGRFAGCPWYGGAFRANADSYQLFEAESDGYLILHLECNAPDAVLEWANDVLASHADRHTIISAHMFLGPLDQPASREDLFAARKGVMRWSKCHGPAGNSPQQIWDKCLSRHPKVLLILCGDQSRTQAMRMQLAARDGHAVSACLSDYGGADEGWLRIYRFYPRERRIDVLTYGVATRALCAGTSLAPDPGAHCFSLHLT